jgi:hypothetical protein
MRRASAKAKALMARDPKQPVNFRDWTEVLAGTVLPWERHVAFKSEARVLVFVRFVTFVVKPAEDQYRRVADPASA